MIKIDTHQHFWVYDPDRYSWIDSSMQVLKRDFLPEHLHPLLSENGIDGTVVVQAAHTESETEFFFKLAEENKFIKGIVGWVDLTAENAQERLEFYSENKIFKGIRHILQDEPEDFIIRPDFLSGLSRLSKLGLAYDIVVREHQLPAAVDLVRQFPDQKFVLDHIGKPQISTGIDPAWRSNIRELSALPNVNCKLSGMVSETKNFQWEKIDFPPFMDEVVDAFGIDRVMFGSNWPVCLFAAEYREVVEIIEDYLAAFSLNEQAKMLGGNAVNFYKLKA
jgi:L-fuconolactonase